MKKITNIFIAAALALGAVSCSQESPFDSGEKGNGYGRVLTSSLAVQLKGEQTRASDDTPNVKDFTVEFYNTTNMATAVETFKYSEMPEVVSLPAGITYKVVARYGDNPEQAWNAPYYYGESADFDVEVDKIVDNIDPITCKLSNVKVTINFEQSLAAVMSTDSKVNVKVGTSGELTFTKDTDDNGYFAYVEGSNTLIATFTGTVEGDPTTEIKSYSDVKPGVHYSITFRLHSPNAAGSGTATPGEDGENGINIEAAVSISDISGDINIGDGIDEIILDDETERPSEGDDPNNPDNPNNPDDPNPPAPPAGEGPTVTPFVPEGASGTLVDFNKVNDADGLICAFNVDSSAESGFTQFEVDIISERLTPEELGGIGLAQHLDLVDTPDDLLEAMEGLGFPTNVRGLKHAEFNISGFMGMLMMLGSGEHTFRLTISDENGTTVVNLRIKC